LRLQNLAFRISVLIFLALRLRSSARRLLPGTFSHRRLFGFQLRKLLRVCSRFGFGDLLPGWLSSASALRLLLMALHLSF
jgi:hypothetical protein